MREWCIIFVGMIPLSQNAASEAVDHSEGLIAF